MKPALALDLDDLIYPFMQTLVPFTNARYGHTLDVDEFDTHNFEILWGSSREEASRRIHECFFELDGTSHPAPMAGADAAVKKLAEHFRLFIVTARPDEYRERTQKWLITHFPQTFEDLILCNLYIEEERVTRRTKASVVLELDAVGLVDDSPTHITDVALAGRTAILFGDYRWNRAAVIPPNAHRANTWTEVTTLLLGEN